jgi:hypothetical protein
VVDAHEVRLDAAEQKGLGQPRHADAGRAREEHDPPAVRGGGGEGVAQDGKLVRPADEELLPRGGPPVHTFV